MQQTLNTRQNRRDVISRTPPVLQDVQTQFAIGIHVGMKHFGKKLDGGWFVGIGFVESQHELERAVFKWRVCGTEDDGVPDHEVVSTRCARYATRRIGGEAFEVSNQSLF